MVDLQPVTISPIKHPRAGQKAKLQKYNIIRREKGSTIPPIINAIRPIKKGGADKIQSRTLNHPSQKKMPTKPIKISRLRIEYLNKSEENSDDEELKAGNTDQNMATNMATAASRTNNPVKDKRMMLIFFIEYSYA